MVWNIAYSKARISVLELNSIIKNSLEDLDLKQVSLGVEGLANAEVVQRYTSSIDQVLKQAVEKIIINEKQISVLVNKSELARVIKNCGAGDSRVKIVRTDKTLEIIDRTDSIEIVLHIAFRSYAGRKIASFANGTAISINKASHDQAMIQAIVRSYKWNKMLDSGEVKSVKAIADRESLERTYVGDIMRLKYLSPEITTMILHGSQPRDINVSQLLRQQLPLDWNEQKKLLNIA